MASVESYTKDGIDALISSRAGLASPAFTGTPTAPTPTLGDDSTKIATTAFVQDTVATVTGTDLSAVNAAIALKAPIASPTFTGNPTAPTPTAGNNDTSIATTAFVQTAVSSKAPIASPAFTGNPTAPTPTAGDNDTSIATTAFVKAAIDAKIVILTQAAYDAIAVPSTTTVYVIVG